MSLRGKRGKREVIMGDEEAMIIKCFSLGRGT